MTITIERDNQPWENLMSLPHLLLNDSVYRNALESVKNRMHREVSVRFGEERWVPLLGTALQEALRLLHPYANFATVYRQPISFAINKMIIQFLHGAFTFQLLNAYARFAASSNSVCLLY